LAQEVLDLIKQLIGVEDFSDVYSKSNKKRTERIEERKRKSAQIVNILKLLISFMIISIFLNLFLGCN
jgi:hypothetical protein